MTQSKLLEVIENIKNTFRPHVFEHLYRSIPLHLDVGLDRVHLFDCDFETCNVTEIDKDLEAWLCISPEGYRAFTPKALIFLLTDERSAIASSVIGNYLSCAAVDPKVWLSKFSNEELDVFLDSLNTIAGDSSAPNEYLDIISAVNKLISR